MTRSAFSKMKTEYKISICLTTVGLFCVSVYLLKNRKIGFFPNPEPLRVAIAVSRSRKELVEKSKLIGFLSEQRLDISCQVWDDPSVEWKKFGLIILYELWSSTERESYFAQSEKFFSWLHSLTTQRLFVANSPYLIQDFFDKADYLLKLSSKGVPIIPMRIIKKGSTQSLIEIIEETGWNDIVVKRGKSDLGVGLCRIIKGAQGAVPPGTYSPEDYSSIFNHEKSQTDIIVQQFMPEILTRGEISTVFIGNEFQFALRKLPNQKNGDFRTQRCFRGETPVRYIPSEKELSQLQIIYDIAFEHFPPQEQPLACRIDVIFSEKNYYLMEIEAIDPWLFFEGIEDISSLRGSLFKKYFEALVTKYQQYQKALISGEDTASSQHRVSFRK